MRIINVSFKTGTNEIYNILKRNISFNFLFFSRIVTPFADFNVYWKIKDYITYKVIYIVL